MKILKRLIRTNYILFIFVFFILAIVTSSSDYIFNLPDNATDNSVVNELKEYPIILFVLLTVVLIPFIETVMFQGFVIELIILKVRKKLRFCISISLSSLLFGIAHFSNIYYFISTLLVGIILALAYYLTIYRKESSILTVTVIHGMINLAAFIDEFYF